jgi:hypothetical protein
MLSVFFRTAIVLLAVLPLLSQQRVDPRNLYERLICVVPMIGVGTPDDPRRPMFVPAQSEAVATGEGIIAFTSVLSDDGRFALVEFVARDRAAFRHIFAGRDSRVRIFEKGKSRKADIENEFRRHRRDFDLGAVLP